DGIGGITFDQQLTSFVRQRASYSLAISHQTSTNLTLDPPYTPQFDGHIAPFAFSDFRFDLFNTFNRHHASYQADVRMAHGAGAGAGRGIKEPTVLPSFSPSAFLPGNPGLAPERSRSVEAGVGQRLAQDRVRVEVTWLASRYRNLISTRTTNPATFEAEYFN